MLKFIVKEVIIKIAKNVSTVFLTLILLKTEIIDNKSIMHLTQGCLNVLLYKFNQSALFVFQFGSVRTDNNRFL